MTTPDRNEYMTFRDTRLEEAVRSAIIQMNKMADDYLRDYLTARGFTLATPEHDAKVAAKALRIVESVCMTTDGDHLDGESEIPVGEVMRMILEAEEAFGIEREAIEGDA